MGPVDNKHKVHQLYYVVMRPHKERTMFSISTHIRIIPVHQIFFTVKFPFCAMLKTPKLQPHLATAMLKAHKVQLHLVSACPLMLKPYAGHSVSCGCEESVRKFGLVSVNSANVNFLNDD